MKPSAAGVRRPAAAALADWERLATDAVGTTIEFWGFKQNHGRIWALLYLRGVPMDAAEIRRSLDLSKGAVSMVSRELERWGVIHRTRAPGETVWRFRAETELRKMIGRVIAEREARLVTQVETGLQEATRRARRAHAEPEQIERLDRLTALAHTMSLALEAFMATARLDVRQLVNILAGETGRRVRRLSAKGL